MPEQPKDFSDKAKEQLVPLADDLKAICARIVDILLTEDRTGALDVECEGFTVSLRPKLGVPEETVVSDRFVFDLNHIKN